MIITDRTVKVSLTAQVSGYIAGMKQAAAYTSYVGNEAEKLALKRESIRQLGTTLLAIGAVAAAGVGLAVKSFADFDQKMAQVKTLSHATASEMDSLAKSALTMGQKIGFSATETADAEIELVKAGLSVANIMSGALKGSLDLAAAGQIDVGNATEIATIALTEFGLKGKDVPHVADLLAAGADKALGGVSDLGEALKSGGLVASQFGLSLDDTVGTLSAFANAGLLGEMAGTTLRQMFLKLGNPSKQAADTMKQLGINLYDASGHFVGITNLSGQLKDKLGGLSEAQRNSALAVIFGSRAIQGANVLYTEGAKGIGGWISKVDDTGFAAQQAAGKMDNLKGDLSKLNAAFQTNLIESGSQANDVLRGTTQAVTNLIALFGDLPGPVQTGVMAVGAIVAVVGLLGGGLLTVVPRIAAMKTALQDLNLSLRGITLAGGAVVLAVTGLVTILSIVANKNAEAKARTDAFSDSLDQNTGALTDNSRALTVKQLTDSGAIKAAHELGLSLKVVTDAALGNADAIAEINKKQSDYETKRHESIHSGEGYNKTLSDEYNAWNTLSSGVGQATKTAQDGEQKWKDNSAAMGKNAEKSTDAAGAYKSAADQAKDLADQVANLTDQINTANGVGQDAVSANASYQKTLADADDTIKKAQDHIKGYSLGIDENTASGAANAAMLSDLAKQNEDAAKKQLALDGDTDNYQKTLATGRQAVIDRAEALGATADQAQALADKVAAIPTDVEIKAVMDASQANKALADFNSSLQKFKASNLNVTAYVRAVGGMASGGTVHGVGTAKSDSNLAYLSRGEEVIQEPYASAFRPELKMMNVGVRPHFADGGTFSPASYTPAPPRMYMPGPGVSQGSRVQVNNNITAPQNIDPNELATAIDNRSNWSLRRLL